MAYIRTIPPEEATGDLRRQYEAALKRAGRVFNIIRIQSLNPSALRASNAFYLTVMKGPGPLERPVREMLATVTARTLDCFY
ncbi:MAG: hypothetical protein ACE5HP_07485 [Gemmatimonadota bacterium]